MPTPSAEMYKNRWGYGRYRCTHCRERTFRLHPILDVPVCLDCQRVHPNIYRYITKTRAKEVYRLRPDDLEELEHVTAVNPHYERAAPMQLYLLSQVKRLACKKYGSDEPYIVGLQSFSAERLDLFARQPERLLQLPPEQFQYLVANRLDDLGLDVKVVGNVYRKDGGIDLIAVPRSGVPFILAVQVKHHRTWRGTGVAVVRDFSGVMHSGDPQFDIGMIVTNTAFTADARWFAANRARLLRLRDGRDLCRWLKGDFCNEAEYREIPREIYLAPGVRIETPVRELWVPGDSREMNEALAGIKKIRRRP